MMLASGREDVLGQLMALDARKDIPPSARKQCRALIERLTCPVRVVVAGPPHGGKSSVINMLAEAELIPTGAGYPTTEICYGSKPRTLVTYQDGTRAETVGIALSDFDASELAFVHVEAPIPRLRDMCFLEVVSDGSPEDQTQALNWAMPRTDIILWCAQDFPERDRRIWSRVPEEVKHHSYFVLSKADLVAAAGVVSNQARQLQARVAGEFHGLFPVSARQARAAQTNGAVADAAALRASGGPRLVAELARSVERGRQAIADSGLLFLNRFGIDVITPVRPAAPAAATPPPAAAVATPRSPATTSEEVRRFSADGFAYLRQRSKDLAATLSTMRTPDSGAVLGHCMETIEHLADVFADAEGEDDAMQGLKDTVAEASDIVMLLQLEEDAGPAADAVTLLLQLRREFEARLAA